MILAAGCQDRMARIYQLNAPYDLIATTKNESMPVVSCKFYKESYLFTSASDSLKVWNIKKGCTLLDSIESSCRGVIDMHVSDTQTQQIAYSNNTLSLHVCKLSTVNFTNQTPEDTNPSYRVPKDDEPQRRNTMKGNTEIRSTIQKRGMSLNKNMISDVQRSVGEALNNVEKLGENSFAKSREDSAELNKLLEEHNKFMNIMSIRARTI